MRACGRVKAREEWGHVGGRGRGRGRGACQGDVLAGRRAAVRRHQVDHDGRAGMQRGGFARVLAAMVSGVVCRNSTHDPSRRRGPPQPDLGETSRRVVSWKTKDAHPTCCSLLIEARVRKWRGSWQCWWRGRMQETNGRQVDEDVDVCGVWTVEGRPWTCGRVIDG